MQCISIALSVLISREQYRLQAASKVTKTERQIILRFKFLRTFVALGRKNPDVLIEKRNMCCFPTVNLTETTIASSKQ